MVNWCIHFWRPIDFEFQQAKSEVSKEKSEKQENPADVPKRPKMQLVGHGWKCILLFWPGQVNCFRKMGRNQQAKEMIARVQKSENYYQALHIISEYVETELSARSFRKPPSPQRNVGRKNADEVIFCHIKGDVGRKNSRNRLKRE